MDDMLNEWAARERHIAQKMECVNSTLAGPIVSSLSRPQSNCQQTGNATRGQR